MKKLSVILTALVAAFVLIGCNGDKPSSSTSSTPSSNSSSTFTPKPVDGIEPIFDEGMGYYNTAPSILVNEDKSYIFYTSNKEEGIQGNDVIAAREISGDTYGEKKIVLEPSTSGWDSKHIGNADVIKGEFKYKDVTYSYLMAYQGNDSVDEKNYSVGIAVSNDPLNSWVKVGTEPLVKYDKDAYGDSWGIGQPSLVSYDQKGKVYLFFTMGDSVGTVSYVRELDLTNLSDIKGNVGFNSVPTKGLIENNIYIMLNDADYALDTENDMLYVVRNYNPESATAPKLNSAVQVARIEMSKLYTSNATWEIVEERVNMLDLETDETGGWERVYSACIAANGFGQLETVETIKLGLTVTSYDIVTKDYMFYQTILVYDVANID